MRKKSTHTGPNCFEQKQKRTFTKLTIYFEPVQTLKQCGQFQNTLGELVTFMSSCEFLNCEI